MPNLNYRAVLMGTLISISLSLLLGIIAGFIYHFSTLSEQTLNWSAPLVLLAGIFSGALLAGREAGNNGLLHGLAVGSLFFLLGLLVKLLFQAGPSITIMPAFEKLLLFAAAGAIGGILGVGSNS